MARLTLRPSPLTVEAEMRRQMMRWEQLHGQPRIGMAWSGEWDMTNPAEPVLVTAILVPVPGFPLRHPPVRRGWWATLVAWLRWRRRRPHPALYGGDWSRFRRDLERWRSRRP